MKDNVISRWSDAQREELTAWKKIREITENPRDEVFQGWFEWSREVNIPPIDKKCVILDSGCGPHGIIQAVPKGIRVGLDPLMSEYKKIYPIPSDINFLVGVGEHLPFKDHSIDIIFSINNLDHVINPKDVINEVTRISKNILILDTNTTPYSDRFMMKLGYKPTLDIYHPHTLSAGEILNIISSNEFAIQDLKYNGSKTRPTMLLYPLLMLYRKYRNPKTSMSKERGPIFHTESRIHSIIKRYFLDIINFFLFRISKRRFSDNIKLIAHIKKI